jgi:hypothetical protein
MNRVQKSAKSVASRNLAIGLGALLVAVSALGRVNSWGGRSPMLAARSSPACGIINGLVYVAGGWNRTDTPTLQAYNPAAGTWFNLAEMPGGRYQGDGAGVISNQLYIAGGWTTSPGLPNNNLWVYDPAVNTWSSATPMPILSACGGSGVINNKLYVTTACDGYSGYRNFLHVYDPSTAEWESLAGSVIPHSQPAVGVINGQLYVAGGVNDSGTTSVLEVYDPSANSWTIKASMPSARYAGSSVVWNGKLYVIGGIDDRGIPQNSVEIYDPLSDRWSTDTAMPSARPGTAAGVVNGVVYVVGGLAGSPVATLEAFEVSPAGNRAGAAQRAASIEVSLDLYAGIKIVGKIGATYEVDYRTNLNIGNWILLTNVVLSTSPYLVIDPVPANQPTRYYRTFQMP